MRRCTRFGSPNCDAPAGSLSLFDFVSLVIGSIIGADVYVVSGLGAGLLGPALLVAWLIGGVLAGAISLCFAQCATILPSSGGSYAYVRATLGEWPARIIGWALYLAEWSAIAVFPVAAVRYLSVLFPLSWLAIVAFKTVFVLGFTAVNLMGARIAGWTGDALTIGKLIPLGALVLVVLPLVIRQPALVSERLVPFAPFGWGGLGTAVVFVFWAYAGFEVAVLPARAIERPAQTMPRGMLLGVGIAIVFYLLTNLAVFLAVPWRQFVGTSAPLAVAMAGALAQLALPAAAGTLFMTAGALISIGGVNQADMFGSAALVATLAESDVFPRWLAHENRFESPDVALLAQGATALVASLLLNLGQLINVAVFFLILVYVATAAAAAILIHRVPERTLHWPGMRLIPWLAGLGTLALVTSIAWSSIVLGIAFLAVGAAVWGLEKRLSG